jgi:thiol-disulfide isomerase/thioredoxin
MPLINAKVPVIKKILYILFALSISCNVFFVFDYYEGLKNKEFAKIFIENTKIKNIPPEQGNKFLFEKIDSVFLTHSTKKKYYFISIWNTMCKPCVKEMPILDSLADKINRTDICYIYLTENSTTRINEFLKKHNLSSRNFIFINDADLYISSVLKKHNLRNRQYPIQLLIDSNGREKYFQIGTLEKSDFLLIANICKSI